MRKQRNKNMAQVRAAVKKRKQMRFIYYLCVIAMLAVGITLGSIFLLMKDRVKFDANSDIELTLEECNLWILNHDDKSESSPIYLDYRVPRSLTVNNGGSEVSKDTSSTPRVFKAKNAFNIEHCYAKMYIKPGTVLGSLRISCPSCNIVQDSDQLTITNKLDIIGDNVNATFKDVKAGSFGFEATTGYIQLSHIDTSSSANEIKIKRTGDIIIQSTKETKITGSTDTLAYCLAAPHVEEVTAPLDDCGLHCIIEYNLCASSPSCSPTQTFTVTSTQGNIYGNLISEVGGIVDEGSYNIKQGNLTLTGIELDSGSAEIIDKFDYVINDTSKNSPQIIFNLGNIESKSSHYSKWIVSSNPAYAYMKPWWVSIFSATILRPHQIRVSGFLLPGFCPYYPQYTQSQLKQIQDRISRNITNENVLVTFVKDDSMPDPPVKPEKHSGIFEYSDSRSPWDKWYSLYIRQDGTTGLTDNDINQKIIILLAIIVSLLIAVYVTFLMTELTILAINMMYYKVVDFANHVENYSRLEKTKQQLLLEKKEEEELEKAGIAPPKKKEVETTIKKYTFRNIMKYAPSLSAFIDYLTLILYRQFSNSVDQFYQLLFKEVPEKKTLDEAPDPQKDMLKGTDAKVLYEKFCFMNHLVEQRLTDKKNLRILRTYGFDIVSKDDIMSDVFIRINIKSHDNILAQVPDGEEMNSLKIFMEKNVEITSFEQDQVEVDYFIKLYYNFCDYNRLPKVIISPTLMKTEYGIDKKSVPQQFIMRRTHDEEDEEFKNPDRSFLAKLMDIGFAFVARRRKERTYIIDIEKLNNHFALLSGRVDELNQDQLERATVDLILYKGWQIWDFLTVVFHMSISGVVTVPLILLVIIMECQYSPYSLKDPDMIILASDISRDLGALLHKLFLTFGWNIAIVVIVCIFWVMSFFDTILYYSVMEFPQDKSFKMSEQGGGNFLQKLSRRFEWILILVSLMFYFGYVGLVLVWLLLGAIINPNAFLPFTSAAVTFITFVRTKYTQFRDLSKNGTKAVMEYLDKVFGGVISKVIGKISESLEKAANFATDQGKNLLKTKTFQTVAGKLTEAGIIDQGALDDFTKKVQALDANAIVAGATAVALDPNIIQKEMENLANSLKEKAIEKVKEEALKRGIPPSLVDLVIAVMTKDKVKTKESVRKVLEECSEQGYFPSYGVEIVIEILYPQCVNKEETVTFVATKVMKAIFDYYYIYEPSPEVIINMLRNLKNLQDLKFEQFIIQLKNTLVKAMEGSWYGDFYQIKPFLPTLDIVAVLAKEKPDYWKLKEPCIELIKNGITLCSGQDGETVVETFSKFISLISSGYEVMYEKDPNDPKAPPRVLDSSGMFKIVLNFCKQLGIDKDLMKNMNKGHLDFYDEYSNPEIESSDKLIPSLIYLIIAYIKQETHDLPMEVIKEFAAVFGIQNVKNNLIPFCFNLVNAIFNKPYNFFQRINTCLSNYTLHPEMQNFIKIVSCYCLPDFESFYKNTINVEKNMYFKEMAKSMKVEPEEFLGLINLISDKQGGDNDAFFELILSRMKIDRSKMDILKSLIDLFLSNDEVTILRACKELNLEFSHFLLASKGLYNPAFIPTKEFLDLGVPPNSDVIKEKDTIFAQNDEDYEYWKASVRSVLGLNLPIKEVEFDNNDTKNPKILDQKLKVIEEYRALEAQVLLVKIFFNNWDTTTFSKKNVTGFIDAFNNSTNNLKTLLSSYDPNSDFNGIDFLVTVLSIAELKLIKGKKYPIIDKEKQLAIKNLCEFMAVKEEVLQKAIQIFTLDDTNAVVDSIISFFPNEKDNKELLVKCLDYATKQVGIIRSQSEFISKDLPESIDLSNLLTPKNNENNDADPEKTDKAAPENLNIPAGLFKKLFFSHMKIGVNDVMEFANLILRKIINSLETREQFMMKCYQLVLFAKGLLPESSMKSLLSIDNPSFQKIFKLFTITDDEDRYTEITDFIHDKDHPIKIFIAAYALLCSKDINIKTHEKRTKKIGKKEVEEYISISNTPKQYLSRIFNIPITVFDVFDIALERDINKFIQKSLPLFRTLTGDSLVDVNMIETIFSLAFAEHFNPAYLSKKLEIVPDLIVFFTTILRLSRSATRNKELATLNQSASFKSVCNSKLKIQINELEALTKLIFNIFDSDSAVAEILQNLNLSEKVDIDSFKGLAAINKPIEPKLPFTKNRIVAEALKTQTKTFFESLELDVDYAFIIARLSAGDFLIMREYRQLFDWIFPSDDPYAEEAIRNLAMGVCGLLNNNIKVTKDLNDDVDRFVKEYYPPLNKFGHHEIDYSNKKDEKVLPNNSLAYALYLTYHTLDITPQWTQIFMFDMAAYKEVQQKIKEFTPEILLAIALNFIHMPETVRDVLGIFEWYQACGEWLKKNSNKEAKGPCFNMDTIDEYFANRFTFEYERVAEFATKSGLMQRKEFWKYFNYENVYYKGINTALFGVLCMGREKEDIQELNKHVAQFAKEPTFDFLEKFVAAEKAIVEKKLKKEESKEESKEPEQPEKLDEREIKEQKRQKRIAVGRLVRQAIIKLYETVHCVVMKDKNNRAVRIPGYALTNLSILGTIVQLRETRMDYNRFLYNLHQLWANIERKLYLEDPFYKMSKFKMMKLSGVTMGRQIGNIVEFCLPGSLFTDG